MPSNLQKICVLADQYIPAYQVEMLEEVAEDTGVSIPLVIVNKPTEAELDPDRTANVINSNINTDTVRLFFELLSRERAWTFVLAEKKISEMFSEEHRQKQVAVEEAPCFSNAEIRKVTPIQDGNWFEFPSDTVATVDERCDVILRLGFGLIRGDILNATEHGVLSFHPADIRRYRGLGPPQAFVDGREKIGATLQRLTEDIDGGEIVAYDEIGIRDCSTLWDVYNRVHSLEPQLLKRGIENLQDPTFETHIPDSLGEYNSTTSRRSTGFASRILWRNLLGRFNSATS